MLSLLRLERKQKKLFKFVSNSHVSLSFLLIWNWNDTLKYIYTVRSPLENHTPNPDQNGQRVYPFSDQNGAKTLPDGVAHTSMAYIREYLPPGR